MHRSFHSFWVRGSMSDNGLVYGESKLGGDEIFEYAKVSLAKRLLLVDMC